MTSFVEEATLRIDDKQARSALKSLNREINSLLRNARKLNKQTLINVNTQKAQGQIRALVNAIGKIPRSKTTTLTTRNVTRNVVENIVNNRNNNYTRNTNPRNQNNNNNPNQNNNQNNNRRNRNWFGQRIGNMTLYGGATFTGAVSIAYAALSATNAAQATDTRLLSIFANDEASRNAVNQAGAKAATDVSRISETRGRQIATDLLLGGVTKENVGDFTQLFARVESSVGALFPGLERSVTLFNNKLINLGNSTDDLARSQELARGAARGIAAAGESFNAPTALAAVRQAGIAPTINEKGLFNLIQLTDALGQQAGTQIQRLSKELFTPAEQAGAGGGVSKGAVAELEQRGLRGFTKEERGRFFADPTSFIEEVLGPRLRAQGVDTSNREQLATYLSQAGFNQTTQRLLNQVFSSIGERAQQYKATSGLDPNNPDAGTAGNLALSFANLAASFDTFTSRVLTPIAETLAPVLNSAAEGLESIALSATKVDDLALAASAAATAFGAFKVGGKILDYFNPLTASAAALDGSAVALTRAAVALGGAAATDVVGDLPGGDGTGKKGGRKGRGLMGLLAGGGSIAARGVVIAGTAITAAEILSAIDPKGNLWGLTEPIDNWFRKNYGVPGQGEEGKGLSVSEVIDAIFKDRGPVAPPMTADQKRFADLQTERSYVQQALADAKTIGGIPDQDTINALTSQLSQIDAEISAFQQAFGTSVQGAGTAIQGGMSAGAQEASAILAGVFSQGAEVLASRIVNAIGSAVINAPKVAASTPQANTGAVTPTE